MISSYQKNHPPAVGKDNRGMIFLIQLFPPFAPRHEWRRGGRGKRVHHRIFCGRSGRSNGFFLLPTVPVRRVPKPAHNPHRPDGEEYLLSGEWRGCAGNVNKRGLFSFVTLPRQFGPPARIVKEKRKNGTLTGNLSSAEDFFAHNVLDP